MNKYVLERRNGKYWIKCDIIHSHYKNKPIDYLKNICKNDSYEHYRIVIENKNYRKVIYVQLGKRVFNEPAINE